MKDFIPTVLGITAFMVENRIDFVLDGPEMESAERCSAFYNNPEAELKLEGKKLQILDVVSDKKTGEVKTLVIRWGRKTIELGRRSAAGPTSFYRSLGSNNNAGPKSAEEILNALQGFLS